MKRPIGVIVSAVLLVLISLFQLLMAFLMALGGVVNPYRNSALTHPGASPAVPVQPWMHVFAFGLAAFFLALAVWGIATVVGLLKMRRWARYSVLVIGGGMALIGLFSLLAVLVMMVVPLPVPPGTDASHAQVAHTFARILLGVIAIFYGLLLGLGAFWLVYFNRKEVRESFAQAQGKPIEDRRPFLIAIVAVLNFLGAGACLLMALLPFPATFFGFVLHGPGKDAVCLAYAALAAASGFGLWRMEEWGRLLTIAVQVLGIINCLIVFVLELVNPSWILRYGAEIDRAMNLPPPPQGQWQKVLSLGTFGMTVLLLAAIIALLHYYRGRFGRPVAPPRAEPMTLA